MIQLEGLYLILCSVDIVVSALHNPAKAAGCTMLANLATVCWHTASKKHKVAGLVRKRGEWTTSRTREDEHNSHPELPKGHTSIILKCFDIKWGSYKDDLQNTPSAVQTKMRKKTNVIRHACISTSSTILSSYTFNTLSMMRVSFPSSSCVVYRSHMITAA